MEAGGGSVRLAIAGPETSGTQRGGSGRSRPWAKKQTERGQGEGSGQGTEWKTPRGENISSRFPNRAHVQRLFSSMADKKHRPAAIRTRFEYVLSVPYGFTDRSQRRP